MEYQFIANFFPLKNSFKRLNITFYALKKNLIIDLEYNIDFIMCYKKRGQDF